MSYYWIIHRKVFNQRTGELTRSAFLYYAGAFRSKLEADSVIVYINPYYSRTEMAIQEAIKLTGFHINSDYCIINGTKCKITPGIGNFRYY